MSESVRSIFKPPDRGGFFILQNKQYHQILMVLKQKGKRV